MIHAVAAVALAALPLGTAAAQPSGPPSPKPEPSFALNIAIDNGQTVVRQGDRLTYTTEITNSGAVGSPALWISQNMVPGLRLLSSTPEAEVSSERLEWSRSLAAGEKARFSSTVEVGELSAHLRRLAVVACAAVRDAGRPIVCSAHSDQLAPAAAGLPSESGGGQWYLLAGIGGFLLIVVAFTARRLLRRRPAERGLPPA
ncbi:hypothetical protein Acor_26560 [Acrocarpospora corrugata]|uniref:DUF11 domain-containing protein n=1 Tax=Acrocarpospora corrugata TaxID=35763 RepID=A0A5M3VXY5_9ACTN|nr:DUF11 domain-containing protein [Acrocarpospora corrugata]GES00592.1 hypothetical protein Acor_26560 [Acrocarpospora corrugata]